MSQWTLARDLAWALDEDALTVGVMRLPHQPPMVLQGVAAIVFLDVADGLDPVASASEHWPDQPDAAEVVADFLDELVANGVVVRSEPVTLPQPTNDAAPYRVLFVCTANICRSAYADVVSRGAGIPGVSFSSAGTHGLVGQPIDPPMADLVNGRGDAPSHRARQLTREIAAGADLVLTMSERHRDFVLEEWPDLARRTFVIGQVSRELGRLPESVDAASLTDHLWTHRSSDPGDEVPDPYRRGPEAAQRCAGRIDRHLSVILPTLERLTSR